MSGSDVWDDVFPLRPKYQGAGSDSITPAAREQLGLPVGNITGYDTENNQDFFRQYEEAHVLRIRSKLLRKISRKLKSYGHDLEAISRAVGIPVEQIDDAVTGKIDMFTVDLLIKMAVKLDIDVAVSVEDKMNAHEDNHVV